MRSSCDAPARMWRCASTSRSMRSAARLKLPASRATSSFPSTSTRAAGRPRPTTPSCFPTRYDSCARTTAITSMRSSTSSRRRHRSPSPIQAPSLRNAHPTGPPVSPIGPPPVPNREAMAAWSRCLAASRNSATTPTGPGRESGPGGRPEPDAPALPQPVTPTSSTPAISLANGFLNPAPPPRPRTPARRHPPPCPAAPHPPAPPGPRESPSPADPGPDAARPA